jgi:hypothetical protein
MNEKHSTKPLHLKEICECLQKEVDSILTQVNEQAFFAEFRDEEILDLKAGENNDISCQVFDERIIVSPRKHSRYNSHAHGSYHKSRPKKVKGNLVTTIRFLFTTFEY